MSVAAQLQAFIYPDPNTGCWLWGGADDDHGYGTVAINRRTRKAHRVAYEEWVAPLKPGQQLDHLCRVRCCVNPDHLEPVTQRENILRGESVAALNARKDACKNGHPFTAENTRVRPNGTRNCRECQRQSSLKNYQKSRCGNDAFGDLATKAERLAARLRDAGGTAGSGAPADLDGEV